MSVAPVQGGVAGASRYPGPRSGLLFIRSGSPLTWSISASHTPAESLPLGRARIVTNRVVRPRQGDSGAAPVGADDQVALPVARHPPVSSFFGELVNADHAHFRILVEESGFEPL